MAEAEPRRYRFHPLERRGVVLGLSPLQLASLGLGAVAAVGVARSVPSTGGFLLAAMALVAVGILALWPVRGQPPVAWLPVVSGWARRRAHGPRLDQAPLIGSGGRILGPGAGAIRGPGGGRGRRRSSRVQAPDWSPGVVGIELMSAPSHPGGGLMGVVRDRHAGTWSAVLRVKGRSFALLDAGEKDRRLAAWGSLLASIGRAGTSVHRLQWLETTAPGRSDDLEAYLSEAGGSGSDAVQQSYVDLVAGAGPATQDHDALIVLAVRPRRTLRTERAACEQLGREARLLVGQLGGAELFGGRILKPDELATVVAGAFEAGPAGRAQCRRGAGSGVWPMATDEAWAAYRSDGAWHATFWVSEWPRVEVGPDFLTPLLLSGGCRRVSLVAGPVDPRRAVREAGSARTADLADEELRRRAGFVPSARREREAEGVLRREEELADGHVDYRFSGYVTVTAPSRPELDERCIEIEQAAQQSHLELRRLYGRQEEAFAWTLPFARGLA